jgi:enoyl-CoA hydratase/carnithine racemase
MIALQQTGRVLRITLNRPEKRNALSLELATQLSDAIEKAAEDSSVGAILVHGAGTAFCAGMDLAEMGKVDNDELGRVHERLFTLGARLTKPLIMAVHGAALAGGTGLVANAHIAYASTEATFGLTEIRLALWPFVIYRSVEAAMGGRRTLELALTGRIFGAIEAAGYGLVHSAIPEGDVIRAAESTARLIAGFSPTAVESGLSYLRESCGASPEAQIARRHRDSVLNSSDFHEGVNAFFEKRAPIWPSLGN